MVAILVLSGCAMSADDPPDIDGGRADALDGGLSDPDVDGGRAGALDGGLSGLDVDHSCHWDCFYDRRCVDGEVIEQFHAPVPCSAWTGSCPSFVAGVCAEGCSDRLPSGARRDAPWTVYCEEGEQKIVGDPCASDEDCQPPAPVDGERQYLACDATTGTCSATEPPTPADMGAPCGVTFEAQSNAEGSAYGVVADASCSSGWCRFIAHEDPTCDLHGCAAPCEDDWDCPREQICLDWGDWSDGIAAGTVGSVRACGSRLVDTGLSCHE